MDGARRGSTIIVAIGVLAVLALVAVSYAVAVRTDRAGAAAYERSVDLENSARVVRDEIASLLAADLFGNKIVTPDVPTTAQVGGQTARIWPRMFEDGEYFDTPQTAPGTFDTRDPERQRLDIPLAGDDWVLELNTSPGVNIPPYFPSPPVRDDAWLSNTEPYNPISPLPPGGAHLDWTTWGQFTNLRDGYRWVRRTPNDRVGLWVRADGRYADLGQFFLSFFANQTLRGDPGAELSYADQTNGRDDFTGQPNGPLVGMSVLPGLAGAATEVFHLQIHQMDEFFRVPGQVDVPTYTNADERFFTDTDGDYRPDARWQVLEALDGLLGLRWVAAARIIDNSALVNLNTALEFQNPDMPLHVGDGRTPADVDLVRLMRSAHLAPDLSTPTPWELGEPGYTLFIPAGPDDADDWLYAEPRNATWPNPSLNPVNEHLFGQLQLQAFTHAMNEPGWAPFELGLSAGVDPSNVFTDSDVLLGPMGTSPAPQFTTRLQRYLFNRYFGVSPLQPQTDRVEPYTVTDEAELRAFFGLNNSSTVGKAEQRFDFELLTEGSGFLTGPLRARERLSEARRLAVDPTIPGDALPTTRAIASDTRRHVTTVSGAADFSPVPVLNETALAGRLLFDRPFNTRLSFTGIPRFSPHPAAISDPDVFRRLRQERHDGVRAAFESFAWALAPLAGHRPLMAPLTTDHTGWALSQNRTDLNKYFYGGDVQTNRGPAGALKAAMVAGGLALDAEPGAAYAVLRAASLAINLFDATDDHRIDPLNIGVIPATETTDLPTVARLYNIVHPDPFEVVPGSTNANERLANGLVPPASYPLDASAPFTDSVVRMGVSFSWGDLRAQPGSSAAVTPPVDARLPNSNDALLPESHVGAPTHGVTLAGLDRQPFLRQVYTVAVYADPRTLDFSTNSTFDEMIDPNNPDERIGSIIAWEVGNPWPDAIDVNRLRFAIALDDGNVLQIRPLDATINTAIPPGSYAVYYTVHWKDGDNRAQVTMEGYEAEWRATIEGRVPEDGLRRVERAGDRRGLRDVTDDEDTIPPDGVPFHGWGEGVGLIYLPTAEIPGAGAIVLDRIAKVGSDFPASLPGVIQLDPANTGLRWTGITSMVSTINRPVGTDSGFPAWVIERDSENDLTTTMPGEIIRRWSVNSGGEFVEGAGEVPSTQGGFEDDGFDTPLGDEAKDSIALPNFPAFQLFVPNTELRYTSELLQLCAFTHMYVHAGTDAEGAMLGADIARPDRFGPGTWRTVSEQLGSDAEIYRDATSTSMLNPYLGVLDPTRFVLSNDSGESNLGALGPITSSLRHVGLPEALTIPLALRVLDCFEPLATPEWRNGNRLVQGRVNINTAAQKTLRMLPLIDPLVEIGGVMPQSANPADDIRVPMMLEYRDRRGASGAASLPAAITNLLGMSTNPLRVADPQAEAAMFDLGGPLVRGFVAAGELAILGEWGNSVDVVKPALNPRGRKSFLELGSDLAEVDLTVPTLDVRVPDNSAAGDAMVRPTPLNGGAFADYDGLNDPEERLAIFRAVSNIVTTRSDVFTAYFKVRGYSPQDIEGITIEADPDNQLVSDYLQQLTPRYEGRFLAVFDRSNVRTPVDRPKVLLFIRLPE